VCRSAVNDGSCSPWVMCSCRVVRGDQIRDTVHLNVLNYGNTEDVLINYLLHAMSYPCY